MLKVHLIRKKRSNSSSSNAVFLINTLLLKRTFLGDKKTYKIGKNIEIFILQSWITGLLFFGAWKSFTEA
jgi:hypothetical protein